MSPAVVHEDKTDRQGGVESDDSKFAVLAKSELLCRKLRRGKDRKSDQCEETNRLLLCPKFNIVNPISDFRTYWNMGLLNIGKSVSKMVSNITIFIIADLKNERYSKLGHGKGCSSPLVQTCEDQRACQLGDALPKSLLRS